MQSCLWDDKIYQHTFLSAAASAPISSAPRPSPKSDKNDPKPILRDALGHQNASTAGLSTLNTLGYSPIPLIQYVQMVKEIEDTVHGGYPPTNALPYKPVMFSIAGSVCTIVNCYKIMAAYHAKEKPWMLEVNLSCPNIAGKPPPAYSASELRTFLSDLAEGVERVIDGCLKDEPSDRLLESYDIPFGIKLPPYTHAGQFKDVIEELKRAPGWVPGSQWKMHWASRDPSVSRKCPITFITTTNTLGSSLILEPETLCPAINSTDRSGIGGLGGTALHPLALGNVRTLRRMLDEHEELKDIRIIGVGGVSDGAGYDRMRSVGADAVGVATALGAKGPIVFEEIWKAETWSKR